MRIIGLVVPNEAKPIEAPIETIKEVEVVESVAVEAEPKKETKKKTVKK